MKISTSSCNLTKTIPILIHTAILIRIGTVSLISSSRIIRTLISISSIKIEIISNRIRIEIVNRVRTEIVNKIEIVM